MLCVALSPLGCKSQAEREEARDVARIAHRVDELRDAPNNAKVAPLAALKAEACKQPKVCELKTICVQAYELHVESIQASSKVRQRLRESDDAQPAAALSLLQLAEKNLAKARALIDRCIALEGELERSR